MRRLSAATVAAMLVSAGAQAQTYHCAVPARIDRPHPELPSADQPARILPIGSYTLALTWAPEFCHAKSRDESARFECGGDNRFGFTLHGLWPDGIGKDWPQYCAATPILPDVLIAKHICATPSAQLIQHEWAKHGTCMPDKPADYFARSNALYAKLRFPDMAALSRRTVTVAAFQDAMAAANPGLPANAIRVTVTKRGWLDELWLCLDKSFAYERCRANTGGAPGNVTLKIWRGSRRR